ncbi:2-oxo-hept-4-ene-1,7-dioate hydratase [Castellaniella defragrans]|uniref:2-oxo-hept-3-ene-1,7-dioate hydratase n=1 Tax=Castellaniella defragrans TaxID=75697 RepID=A0A7W9TNG3_CASDE|nr:2-oxo-hepta-3-ene-1,7-dioic acid hydratase [Castellaniella defragrans]KAB0621244.1 2-oxo-hepta-3-ene-1,7-dioic acid hydratase [Castellaniella defragrans]MBB6083774.1 2-oxo-hept-3-ene-1,7-dioate hydratase [Castellaniella defragrans]
MPNTDTATADRPRAAAAESLPRDAIARIAASLHEAERARVQVRAPSLDHPGITIEDAYAIQSEGIRLKLQEGRRIIGRKIGLTSRAMQRSSQIEEPDYGVLLDDMLFENGQDIPFDRFIVPMVEVELVFHLTRDLAGPEVTLFDVLDATDYVMPAIELIDARCHRVDPASGRPRLVMDTISDNAANAGLVLGGRAIRPMDLDLRWAGALLMRNGVIEETGVAAGVLNHPANGIVWLARKLARHGAGLEAGQLILAGSFTRPVAAQPGDTFHIDYGPLGSISNRFA